MRNEGQIKALTQLRRHGRPAQRRGAVDRYQNIATMSRVPLLTPATDAVAEPIETAPLAALLAANVVPQGEIVKLLLKPSRWFILLNSMRFSAVVIVLVSVLHVAGAQPLLSKSICLQLALFLIAGRIMWSLVQWMGRFYILTDRRLLRVCGVFDVRIESGLLTDVESVKLNPAADERALGRGSIDIACTNPGIMTWQTLNDPQTVAHEIQSAVARSKHNGGPLAGLLP